MRESHTALAIAQHHGISDLVARVLAGRGVTVEGAPEFVDPTLRNLMPDPATLPDMESAAGRIADAIERHQRPGERIGSHRRRDRYFLKLTPTRLLMKRSV